jgi:hypothetical protein
MESAIEQKYGIWGCCLRPLIAGHYSSYEEYKVFVFIPVCTFLVGANSCDQTLYPKCGVLKEQVLYRHGCLRHWLRARRQDCWCIGLCISKRTDTLHLFRLFPNTLVHGMSSDDEENHFNKQHTDT